MYGLCLKVRIIAFFICIFVWMGNVDWRSIAFDWNQARAFLVTAEEGSLSAAARALGLTQPTLGRQVSALEQTLKVTLFERLGRNLVLTPSGEDLLGHVKAMGLAANQVSLSASGHSQTLEGSVCLSVSEIYAALILPTVIAKLRKTHPKIKIEIVVSNEASDLQRREADIAIRSFRPTQTELIAKKLKDVEASFYATSDYIETLGQINNLQDLQNADFISVGDNVDFIKGLQVFGLNLTESNFVISTENHIVHWEMTKQGLGIGVVPCHIGDAEQQVQRVISDFNEMKFSVWLTTHQELRTSKRIRLVFDFLAENLVI